uniref:CAND6/7 N-terminal domain-containing protein n=1 Tax=Fagus sylvatica TaxID=28930 RepID=A0A2N9GJR3_FAGSY
MRGRGRGNLVAEREIGVARLRRRLRVASLAPPLPTVAFTLSTVCSATRRNIFGKSEMDKPPASRYGNVDTTVTARMFNAHEETVSHDRETRVGLSIGAPRMVAQQSLRLGVVRLTLWAPSLSSLINLLSRHKNSHIIDDSRGMIYFHKFGFSQHGQASISIKDVSWKSKDHKAQFNASSMGFVLLNDSSFDSFLKETIYIKDFCILSSHYVKVLFTFEKLTTNSSTYNVSTAIDGPSRNGLIFGLEFWKIGGLVDYRYSWVLNALEEGASFAFFVFLFYNFKPIERNPYLVIDEEEENDARNLLETDRFGDTFGL